MEKQKKEKLNTFLAKNNIKVKEENLDLLVGYICDEVEAKIDKMAFNMGDIGSVVRADIIKNFLKDYK